MILKDILKVMVVGFLLASSGASASFIVNDVSQVVSLTGSAIGETGATAVLTTGTWSVWRRGAFVHWALRGSFLEAGGAVQNITRGSTLVGSGGLDKALHGLLFPGSASIERAYRRSWNNDGEGPIAIAAVDSVQLTEPGSLGLNWAGHRGAGCCARAQAAGSRCLTRCRSNRARVFGATFLTFRRLQAPFSY